MATWALDLDAGDEVIVPTFTIISCISALLRHGLVPVLVDCDPDTWNASPDCIRALISPRTRAIMVVHIYGLPVDMDGVLALADEYGLKIIEDSAESIGVKYRGQPCGGFGDISAFSFYANKHITTGEGGMVATNDDNLAKRCRWYRNLCFEEPRFHHRELGRNMRMTNLQAAVGVAQLERLDQFIKKKRRMGAIYQQAFKDLPSIQLPLDKTDYSDNAYWVFGIVLGDAISIDATAMMERLRDKNIGCRPFFWPMHEQPVCIERGMFREDKHAISERIARRGFYIPSGLGITDKQIDRVCSTVVAVVNEALTD